MILGSKPSAASSTTFLNGSVNQHRNILHTNFFKNSLMHNYDMNRQFLFLELAMRNLTKMLSYIPLHVHKYYVKTFQLALAVCLILRNIPLS